MNTMRQAAKEARAPSAVLWASELSAIGGLGVYLATMGWQRFAPRGDGHAVLVLPGLVQTDLSTVPLRRFLGRLGYRSLAWQLGRNTGSTRLLDEHLVARLKQLHEEHGPVSIVGWSMGGLFARALALQMPEAVRQVITLGSPFTGNPKASNAWRLFEALSGERAGDPANANRFGAELQVPATAIYSRRDGIVAWPCCMNEPGPLADNIEVVSSHCGLGHHPAVHYAVADRLAQPADGWKRFEPAPALRWMYPDRLTECVMGAGFIRRSAEIQPEGTVS